MSDLKLVKTLLRKVELKNDGTAEVSWKKFYQNPESEELTVENGSYTGKADEHGAGKIHDDLRAAFKPLAEHWMIRGDEVGEQKGNYPFNGTLKRLEKVTVKSVTFSGGEPKKDEDPQPIAVHITGYYQLSGGGVKNYCSPGIKLDAPGEKYKFQAQLDGHVSLIEDEAYAYVNGKCAPPAQQQINYDQAALGEGEEDPQMKLIGAGEEVDEDEARMERANSTPVDEQ